ncbi:hypothetical protein D9M69_515320 [compost metagenome]
MLQQQALRLAATPGRRVCQGHEHGLQCGQFGFARFAEQGHQQYALEPVGGDLFEPRPALPAAMEQAADLVWRVVQGGGQLPFESGDGVEVHGGGHGCGARILPLFASANSQVRMPGRLMHRLEAKPGERVGWSEWAKANCNDRGWFVETAVSALFQDARIRDPLCLR